MTNLFDKLVAEALRNQSAAGNVRPVVEKELLHHDILREMSKAGLLKRLTFMGGTCLRACYGAQRLSEDLDFTGGRDFKREDLLGLSKVIITRLDEKYELEVSVSEPRRETGNTSTWKIKVITRPGQKDLPAQRINIDICSIPSHQPEPMTIINHYGVEMGTTGLIIQCESREEILLDKIIAFALRPNRIKNRDLWDIAWLKQQNVMLPVALSEEKARDHGCSSQDLVARLLIRRRELKEDPSLEKSFHNEIMMYLPQNIAEKSVQKPGFWKYIQSQTLEESLKVIQYLRHPGTTSSHSYLMS